VETAAAIQSGATDKLVRKLDAFDWSAGPVTFPAPPPGPAQRALDMKHALDGDPPSARDDEEKFGPTIAQLLRDLRAYWTDAATANTPPPNDPCKNGTVDQFALGMAQEFVDLRMSFVRVPPTQNGILTIDRIFPKRYGARSMCSLIRQFSSCVRQNSLRYLDIVTDVRVVPDDVIDFLDEYWHDTYRKIGQTTDAWTIDMQKFDESGCVPSEP